VSQENSVGRFSNWAGRPTQNQLLTIILTLTLVEKQIQISDILSFSRDAPPETVLYAVSCPPHNTKSVRASVNSQQRLVLRFLLVTFIAFNGSTFVAAGMLVLEIDYNAVLRFNWAPIDPRRLVAPHLHSVDGGLPKNRIPLDHADIVHCAICANMEMHFHVT
jgi:hypothetical protein